MRGNEMRGGGLTRAARWEEKMDGISNQCKSAAADAVITSGYAVTHTHTFYLCEDFYINLLPGS